MHVMLTVFDSDITRIGETIVHFMLDILSCPWRVSIDPARVDRKRSTAILIDQQPFGAKASFLCQLALCRLHGSFARIQRAGYTLPELQRRTAP